MAENAHFSVNARLTRLLGESYRSSEAALKELVDNAWDADALNVWITLPEAMSAEPLIVKDDGSGMTVQELQGYYLNIASDKRSRTGDKTPHFNRTVKGRKGIGKFAGLSIASEMQIDTIARQKKVRLVIDKAALFNREDNLETIPLPLEISEADGDQRGTTISLLSLDSRLNFPNPDKLREVLIFDYGRDDSFRVHVNGTVLSYDDIPGTSRSFSDNLPEAGGIRLQFTVSDSRGSPRRRGIQIRVDGKAVGTPQMFGLEDDEDVPPALLKKLYGEVELRNVEDFVTADWGAVVENSKAYQEAASFIRRHVKEELQLTHKREMANQQAQIKRTILERIKKLPENRRKYAELAVSRTNKVLRRQHRQDISDRRSRAGRARTR